MKGLYFLTQPGMTEPLWFDTLREAEQEFSSRVAARPGLWCSVFISGSSSALLHHCAERAPS